MQFVYHPQAGEAAFNVDVKLYDHVFKVRRISVGETLKLRNLLDDALYEYKILTIGKKEAQLEKIAQENVPLFSTKSLHIAWSIIDPKIIEKTLPMLNELGVEKITFFYAAFSQKQFRVDSERMERIVLNSSQQCGRSRKMILEQLPTLKEVLMRYPDAIMLDFSEHKLTDEQAVTTVIIGPEGGFSEKERLSASHRPSFGLNCATILRSETAAIAVASKILA